MQVDSSEKIRDFFRYYEWAQTELATVLTEYYMVGGDCALVKLTQGKENDCEPDRGSANDQVEQISADIGRQRATQVRKQRAMEIVRHDDHIERLPCQRPGALLEVGDERLHSLDVGQLSKLRGVAIDRQHLGIA